MPRHYTRTSEPAHWVRWVIPGVGTMTYLGEDYDRGELIELQGHIGDEKLVRLGYIATVDKNAHTCQCGECGRLFVDERFRDMHGRRRHPQRFQDDSVEGMVPGMESHMGVAAIRDTLGDAEERQLMQEAPLYLDKTKATLET